MIAIVKPLVALVGNPNCGKTTLFNQLTGLNKKTGNWSGVTVASQFCAINYNELEYNLVDLPGIYGLSIDSFGQDELHVKEFLQQQKPSLIINVINAVTLERGLFLTLELLELGVPIISVLNMWDEATQQNITIDNTKLSKLLNSHTIKMVAKTGVGVESLKKAINSYLQKKPNTKVPASEDFESRLEHAHEIANKVFIDNKTKVSSSNQLDKFTTHPVFGMLTFFVAMYVMFFFAINVAAVFIDFFDIATGAILINGGHQLLEAIGLPQWLVVIITDGIGGGIQVVATFIPVIGFLYLVLTWLEDSGYMSRAAFVMNGLMQKIGVSGQAFVPLVVSFGCNVPAIMATRSLPSKRERLVTIMMAPFMSCGARLPVYALFVAAFFSQYAAAVVFALYFIGILMAIFTGILLQKTILPGKAEPFIIELPPWRIPTAANLIIGTWRRLKDFLFGAGKIIVIMATVIQVLNSVGSDFSFGNEDSENSMLAVTAKAIVPVFEPMGITQRNWPAVVGIITGILAKEVVVGTLDTLYTSLDKQAATQQEAITITQQLTEAVVSIKDNGIGLLDTLLDPLGLAIIDAGTDKEMTATQQVSDDLFGVIRDRFADKYAAFAYLLFILLYFPCVAATAAVARESSKKWALFSVLWSTGLGYMVATNFYQLSHFSRNPLSASLWLAALIAFIVFVYLLLKKIGKRTQTIQLNIV
ncbi:MAG: ferrous iron transport protein B [Proteobacteria bacterium]|nr:ferrous iron transport protein B [Pseudomonadota bacterium]